MGERIPELPGPKIFKPKHILTELGDYTGSAPGWYWQSFPSNLIWPGKSKVNAVLLRELAEKHGFKDKKLLMKICQDLSSGANIGCKEAFRAPTRSNNAPTAFEFGPHVSDAIADWLVKGFAFGPIELSQVPSNAKISGIMCKQKPNGSVRIILNLSAPLGSSVNDGINADDFPASMSSTTKWLRVLNRAGKGCWIAKVDWSDAYKHIAVRREDLNLQWFSWLGKAFCELCLIFGSKSSVGLYDRLAKLVLFVVCKESGMPMDMVCQHLDDCAGAAPGDSALLLDFDRAFSSVAERLGIKLAPRDDPDKAFGPCHAGVVFGVRYDTQNWSWSIPDEKLCRLLHDLQEAAATVSVSQETMMRICGKLVDVRPLVPGGRFHLNHILKAAGASSVKTDTVVITAGIRCQLDFWSIMLRTCSGSVAIPDPDARLPPWAWDVYTDASGGGFDLNGRRTGRGVGAVAPGWWSYVPWSARICSGPIMADGRRLNRKMSALELIGPLLVISSGFNMCKGRPVKIWVDNAGSVAIWKKGYSNNCALSSTVANAISVVADGLGCWLDIVKITRCSNTLADMADALSKADFSRFWATNDAEGLACGLEQAWVPRSLLLWLEDPCLDEGLGSRILAELNLFTELLSPPVSCL